MLMRFPLIAHGGRRATGRRKGAKGTRKMTCKSVVATWRVAAAIVTTPFLPIEPHDRQHVDVMLVS